MIIWLLIAVGLAASIATRDAIFIAIAAGIGVAWLQMLLWDIHGHLYRIEEYLNERGIDIHG